MTKEKWTFIKEQTSLAAQRAHQILFTIGDEYRLIQQIFPLVTFDEWKKAEDTFNV